MQTPALLKRAKTETPQGEGAAPEGGAGFKRPNVKATIPANLHDAVDRVVAAGMRYLYSPAMREEVMAAVQSQEPMPQKLASNVAGLLLTLDNQTQGGIPVEALFPAGVELLGEAGEVMAKAGQSVSQEDWNTAALLLMGILGKKMGVPDEQLAQAMGGEESAAGPGEEPMDDAMPENAA
jgi:hypothetical protein